MKTNKVNAEFPDALWENDGKFRFPCNQCYKMLRIMQPRTQGFISAFYISLHTYVVTSILQVCMEM